MTHSSEIAAIGRRPKGSGVRHWWAGIYRDILARYSEPLTMEPLEADSMSSVRSYHHEKYNFLSILNRSEEHTSELQSLMRISYAVFCLKKKKNSTTHRPKQIDDNTYCCDKITKK